MFLFLFFKFIFKTDWNKVDAVSDTVGKIDFKSLNCVGTLPTELGLLTAMTELKIYQNSVYGTLPSELGQLTMISKFIFSDNALTGTIPSELGRLTLISANNQFDL